MTFLSFSRLMTGLVQLAVSTLAGVISVSAIKAVCLAVCLPASLLESSDCSQGQINKTEL